MRTESPAVNIKVIVFDCDGVIFDSKDANCAFYNHILDIFGRPPMNEEQLEYVHVSTFDEAIQRLFQDDPRSSEALDVTYPKPHPESLRKVIQQFEVRPESLIHWRFRGGQEGCKGSRGLIRGI